VAKEDEFDTLQPRVNSNELLITAPLPGDGPLGTTDAAEAFEQGCLAECATLLSLIKRERVEPARRAVMLQPLDISWKRWDDVTLELKFWLPAGSFATSVVRELMRQENIDADITE
jgi:tRNA pseudouridine13 synthase